VLQCSDTLGIGFGRVVVRISWLSLGTETTLEMTSDGTIRDEIRDIDIEFLKTLACAFPDSRRRQSATDRCFNLRIERIQSRPFHGRTKKLLVEMDSEISEDVSVGVMRPVLFQLFRIPMKVIFGRGTVEFT
jgi:hypothetical protein